MDSRLLGLPRTPTPPPPPSPEIKHEHDSFKRTSDISPESPTFSAEESALRQNQVSTVVLHGVPIVSLFIDGKERLCLAQISNTLLKEYSYNEIHNRRVALGITCVQCTPVQLEILRRAGAMPISSRRCGMISKREAERLVKSFLEEHTPPKLPDNFAFCVKHPCGWGCKGQFVPARYNSSRAKCIKCTYCNLFFSPNKFIFHFHRMPDAKYRHPDAANFNSWRRHLFLDYEVENDDMLHAWEDVKAMFNGGSRKRVLGSACKNGSESEFIPFEKKPRFDTNQNHPNFPSPCAPAPNQNYPFMPIPNNPNNMMFQFPTSSQYHMLPSTDEKRPIDNTKINFNEIWKNRPPTVYNPLSFWWAKSLGMYPFSSSKPQFPGEWNMIENAKTQPEHSTTDSRYSAFKPVGLLGSRVFSDYNKFPFLNERKCNNSNNNNVFPFGHPVSFNQQRDIIQTPSSVTTTDNYKSKSENDIKELRTNDIDDQVSDDNCSEEKDSDRDVDCGRDVDICGEESYEPSEVRPEEISEQRAMMTSDIQIRHNCFEDDNTEHKPNVIDLNSEDVEVDQSPPVPDSMAPKDINQSNNIFDMSKEELQRQLLKMMSTQPGRESKVY